MFLCFLQQYHNFARKTFFRVAAIGYYVGDAMALYGYTYAAGLGISSTLFYSGAYGMRTLRGTDDVYNYAISGTANAGAMVSVSMHLILKMLL